MPTLKNRFGLSTGNYCPGRESQACKDKTFCPHQGVLPGFVCQRRSPGDTTLSELGQSKVLFKVGTRETGDPHGGAAEAR